MYISAQNRLYAIIFMVCNAFLMTSHQAIVKNVTHSLSSAQIVFLHKMAVFFIVACYIIIKKDFKNFKTNNLHLYFSKAACSITASLALYKALKTVPLSSVTSITFLEPIIIVLVAAFAIKEKIKPIHVLSLVGGCIGGIIVTGMGTPKFNPDSLWILISVSAWVTSSFVIKALGKKEKNAQYLFFMSGITALVAMPMALLNWQNVTMECVPLILALAVLNLSHLYCMFKAFQLAEFKIIMPFDYTRLLFSALIGTIFFDESISFDMMIGSILIVFSSLMVLPEKRMLSKAK